MFDKIVCVNLKHRKDRWEHFIEEKKFLESHGFKNFERFEAVNGKECGLLPGKPPYPTWSVISLGNLGNVISQRKIIIEAQKDNLDSVLILEDDVEFDKNADINKFLQNVPENWDMIYFGGNHMQSLSEINDIIGKCNMTLTAHAVAIRKTVFLNVLKITEGLGAPIDLYYAMLHRFINAYAPIKPIAWQIGGYSDIEEKNVEYLHIR